MLMAAVAPLAVTQNVIQLDHDDSWYLNRAICFNRSFYDFSACRFRVKSLAVPG
jgi:hypothetical protein